MWLYRALRKLNSRSPSKAGTENVHLNAGSTRRTHSGRQSLAILPSVCMVDLAPIMGTRHVSSDHRGLKPSDIHVTGNTTGDDKDVAEPSWEGLLLSANVKPPTVDAFRVQEVTSINLMVALDSTEECFMKDVQTRDSGSTQKLTTLPIRGNGQSSTWCGSKRGSHVTPKTAWTPSRGHTANLFLS